MKIFKLCKKCGQSKDWGEFSDSRTSKDGKKCYCKPCDRIYNKKRYNEIKEFRQLQIREWNSAHKDKMREYAQRYKNKQRKSLK